MTVQQINDRIKFHKEQFTKMVAMKCFNVAQLHQNSIDKLENLKVAR
jgi:hypothetical protein